MTLLSDLTSSSYMWEVRIRDECSRINPSGFVSGDLLILEDNTTLVILISKVLFTTLRAEKHLFYK